MPVTLTITGNTTANDTGPTFETSNYELVVSEAVPINYLAEVIKVHYMVINV